MTTPEAITRRETTGSWRLWVGIMTGPVAWSIQLGGDWFLAEVVACGPISNRGMVAGAPLAVVAAVFNGFLLAATVAAGLVAARCLATIRRRGDDTTARRAEWMARGGIINSTVFAVIIAASFFVIFGVGGCVG